MARGSGYDQSTCNLNGTDVTDPVARGTSSNYDRIVFSSMGVSTNCGAWPAWSPAGDRLYYRSCGPDREQIWEVGIATHPEISLGEPCLRFEGEGPYFRRRPDATYSVHPDGRLVLIHKEGTALIDGFELLLNWPTLLDSAS